MTYEFQSTLFRTAKQMADAIANEWLSAGGANNLNVQRDFLNSQSDSDLAYETISAWGLSGDWAEKRDFTREHLIEAFSRLRKSISA